MAVAYVDESADPAIGCYLLGAVIVEDQHAEETREALRGLTIAPGKLHWHTEGTARRELITKTIAALDHLGLVVVGRPVHRKQERGRRKCMEVLLPELQKLGARRVVFESRGSQDAADIRMTKALVGRQLLSADTTVSYGDPREEPLLWLPDVICGAALADQRGEDRFLRPIRTNVDLVQIDAR